MILSRTRLSSWLPLAAVSGLVLLSLVLSGCGSGVASNSGGSGGGITTPAAPPPPTATGLQGQVIGGRQAVANATIQLFAVGTDGYGGLGPTGAIKIDDGTVTTNASGNFTLTGHYTCTVPSLPVFILAVDGDAGAGNNPVLELAAALEDCSTLQANANTTFITINEVTTVAFEYAAAQYISDQPNFKHIGTSNTAAGLAGINNAFNVAHMLASFSTGKTPGALPATVTNSTQIQQTINTLANLMASCVNSDGSTATNTPCDKYFTQATFQGSGPVDTFYAGLQIIQHPGNHVNGAYNLLQPGAPFQPTLGVAPHDWTMGFVYDGTAGGVLGPLGIAVDGTNNVWIVNNNGGTGAGSVSKLSATTGAFSGAGFTDASLKNPQLIAVDPTGNAWVANISTTVPSTGSTVTKFTSTGTASSFAVATNGGPRGIAIDGTGRVWTANNNGVAGGAGVANAVSRINNDGTGLVNFTLAGDTNPNLIAIDNTGNAWISDQVGTVYGLTSTGTTIAGSPFTPGVGTAFALAADHAGNIWVSDFSGAADVGELTSAGAVVAGSPWAANGIDVGSGVAIDGDGNAWIASSGLNCIVGVSNAGVPVVSENNNGFQNSLDQPGGLAIDGSGNVWVTSYGSAFGTTITEFIGLAAPVTTPLATAAGAGTLGQRP